MDAHSKKSCGEDEMPEEQIKPFEYFEQSVNQKIHHFYLSGAIDEPVHYVKMIHTIMSAPQQDTIYIHLNTPGGYLSTGIQLVNAMRASEATVVASLEGMAHSLGSLIFLAADQFIVHDNTTMMIHNFTSGIYGKGKEAEMEMHATLENFADIGAKYYIPFLTQKEFDSIVNDSDIWLHPEDVRDRLDKMVKAKQKELKKMMG
jgi:ATP-dependent protease ClpP protease subunit